MKEKITEQIEKIIGQIIGILIPPKPAFVKQGGKIILAKSFTDSRL